MLENIVKCAKTKLQSLNQQSRPVGTEMPENVGKAEAMHTRRKQVAVATSQDEGDEFPASMSQLTVAGNSPQHMECRSTH